MVLSMESLRKAREEQLKAEEEQAKATAILQQKEEEFRKANEEAQLKKELEFLELKKKHDEEVRNRPQPTPEELKRFKEQQQLIAEIEVASNLLGLAELEVIRKKDEYSKAIIKAEQIKNNMEELKAKL